MLEDFGRQVRQLEELHEERAGRLRATIRRVEAERLTIVGEGLLSTASVSIWNEAGRMQAHLGVARIAYANFESTDRGGRASSVVGLRAQVSRPLR